ncbi:hypothetical protein ARMGADRAFT_157634 [Armillaria gallica]|uniref:Methionyl/Valyl/Leucyl/Isoleucyl-tRNA synthetase anticodon-binding domain-containing protein n=1 Tax=Armillaria gallica TaxID=47427 RepID=A0A2H3CRG1_ARMGA|nr:hypothetical protein ARMGADRAFT_157634 [Armillaria gallica]
MDLPGQYMINELQKFEAECVMAYVAYNFPKVVKTLQNLCNITLPSFYFDINKGNLYANALNGYERHTTVFVLKEVCATLSHGKCLQRCCIDTSNYRSHHGPDSTPSAQEIHDSMYYRSKGLVFLEQLWNWCKGSFAIKGFTEDNMKAVKKD